MFSTSTTNNVNLTNAECIKGTYHFTKTDYHNICNGTTNTVPNGGADYFFGGLVSLFLIMIVIGCIKMMFE